MAYGPDLNFTPSKTAAKASLVSGRGISRRAALAPPPLHRPHRDRAGAAARIRTDLRAEHVADAHPHY